jgi:hypothetical protein
VEFAVLMLRNHVAEEDIVSYLNFGSFFSDACPDFFSVHISAMEYQPAVPLRYQHCK